MTEVSVDIKTLTPGALCPLPRGYIHVLNNNKKCINQTSKRLFWNWNHEKKYKIRLQRHLFETCNKWKKWQDVSVDIKTFRNNEVLSRINERPSRINEKNFRYNEVLSRINEKLSRNNEKPFRNNEVLSRINEKPSRNNQKHFSK